jgi:hypothetical protein
MKFLRPILCLFIFPIALNAQSTHYVNVAVNQANPCVNTALSNANSNNFLMYPIPSGNKINVQNDEKIQVVEIYDLSGKRVLQQLFNANQVAVNLDTINNGIYIIQIKTETNSIQQKIVINHD